MKAIVESEFWELFPEAQINILHIKDINNQTKDAEYFSDLLKQAAKEAQKFLTEETFSQNPVVAHWREAFTRFKTKKGARSSIEALLKRVNQGREFTPINPLVDIYNSISLKYAVPCGGEDLEKIQGNLRLGQATGGENFLPLGAEEDAPALPGEIIYYDDAGAICRCLNWREAQRTMLTEETTEAILVIESINPQQAARADQAMEEMKQLMETYFEVKGISEILTKDQPEQEL